MNNKNYYVLFLGFLSFILLIFVFQMINYLSNNNFITFCNIKESFEPVSPIEEKYDGSTTHTVNLPLNTTYSCRNFCGPTARCAITGQQCFADVDCPGCQPYVPPLPKSNIECVKGNDEGGPLIYNQNPQYSELTTDIGTKARIITDDIYGRAPQANFGVDTWRNKSDTEKLLFDQRYKPNQLPYMPDYPKRFSVTGDFIDEGPLAANAYF